MENNQSEDINLLALFKSLFKLILDNKIKFIVSYVIIFALGYFYYFYIKTNEYESSITLSSKILKIDDIKAIVNTIDSYIKGNEYQALSKILNISENDAKSIVKIKALEADDTKLKEQKSKDQNEKIVIYLRSVNHQVFERIQPNILAFIKSSDYYKSKNKLNTEKYLNITFQIDKILNKLDSLNPLMLENYMIENSRFPNIYLNNPGSLSETIIDLYTEKENLKEKFLFETELVIIQPFRNFANVENKSLNKFILAMTIISFIISIIVVGASSQTKDKFQRNEQ